MLFRSRRTRNGAYILKELDGTVWRQAVAAFRIIPYVTRSDKYLQEILQKMNEDSDESEEDSDSYKEDWILSDDGEELHAEDRDYSPESGSDFDPSDMDSDSD